MEASVLKRRNNGVDLPRDFPERLEQFREVSGLSWGELAACLGVETDRVKSLRRGALPGDSMMANLMQLAQRMPGGMETLFPNVVNTLGTEE